MAIGKKNVLLVKALSELKEANYSRSPELDQIYRRLLKGREQFAEIFDKNIKAVMQISSLDLTMQHQTEKIIDIAENVAKATESIFGSSTEEAEAAGGADSQHEELTNTIIEVSTQTEEVYQKIETSQAELTTIKELSDQTIKGSMEMQKDLDDLFQIINRMNEVIAGIDSISLQTNLLALNAAIEASRAGEAGRGFAVVANEIRALAEETQKLTGNMGDFVESIKSASQKSVQSAENTIGALEGMTEKINKMWELNNENQRHVSKVNESVSSIAAVSQELSSSMTEMENRLRDSTDFMNKVGIDLKKAVEPVVVIEDTLDETVKQMGRMAEDPFFHLENREFAQYLQNAISAHHAWLGNLKKMVDVGTVIPLQLDSTKCGFGHFYYAVTPAMPEAVPIWKALEEKHKRFHQFGEEVIQALKSGNRPKAVQAYNEAVEYSRQLIADFEALLRIAGE